MSVDASPARPLPALRTSPVRAALSTLDRARSVPGRRPVRPRLRPAGRLPDGQMWNWRSAARCRTDNSEDLFVTGARQRDARGFCVTCPVRTECLAHALDQQIEFGVWGGMTERERRALLRRRPDVRSWARLLGRARSEHYSGSGVRGA